MQKEFTIQVRFCIDKARYGRDKIFSSQRIFEKSNSVNRLPRKLYTTIMNKIFETNFRLHVKYRMFNIYFLAMIFFNTFMEF